MFLRILIILAIFPAFLFAQNNGQLNNRYMLGQSYQRAGEFEKAKKIYEELFEAQPSNFQFFDALNQACLQLKDYDESIETINKYISVAGENADLYGRLGATYYLMGNENKAFEVWDDALQKLPPNQMNYRIIANYAIQHRAFEKAIDILKKGEQAGGNSLLFAYDLSNLYSLTMQYKEAAEEYCLILSKDPNQIGAVQSRIFSYISKPDALQQTISVVENWNNKNNINFDYLLARLYIEADNFEKAYSLYIKIDEKQKTMGTELFNFGMTAYREGKYKIASDVFSDILDKYPAAPIVSNAKLGYAKTLEAQLDEELNSSAESWKPYSSTEVKDTERINEVADAFLQLTKSYPHSEVAYEAYLRIGKIKLEKENDLSSSKSYLEKIVEESPLSPFAVQAYGVMGKIAILKGDLNMAEFNYSKVVSNARSSEEQKNYARYELARIDFYKGSFEQARQKLSLILKDLKDNTANDAIELSLLLNPSMNDSASVAVFAEAELLKAENKFREAASKYKEIAANQQSVMLKSLSYLRQAEMEIAVDNFDNAEKLLTKISDEGEKNIYADKALFLLGEIYQYGLNKPGKAVEIYEQLLAKFPNSLYLDDARESIIKLRKTS